MAKSDEAPVPIIESPYASARDLPSVREMYQQLQAFNLLKFAMPKEARVEFQSAEATLKEIVGIVDSFYDVLGPRNWIYHNDLNLSKMTEVLANNPTADEAERQLIEYYQDPETLEFMIMRLNGIAPMRPRIELIEKAYADYQAGRYYAVVLVLISVMDGFVNEVEPNQRRGLHTREPEEMNAWDSVTAHHMGLSRAHRAFIRGSRATNTDEIFELHRHGIMHGNMLNYDNAVVATKAWNRLFAVSDWARVVLDPPKPKEPPPTWRELGEKAAANRRQEKILEAWSASEYDVDTSDIAPGSALAACIDFMEAWKAKRYDKMGQLFPTFGSVPSIGEGAKTARWLYEEFPLSDYKLAKVRNTAAAVTLIDARLLIGDTWRDVELKWVHMEKPSATPTPTGEPGDWTLCPHGPTTFIKEVS